MVRPALARLCVAATLALAGACASTAASSGLPRARVALRVITTDGKIINLGSLRGHVVLVTVITTWSDLALLEVPRFTALATRYPRDLEVVTVALDESTDMVRIFEDTFEPPYIVGTVDQPERFTGFEGPFGAITMIPTSVLLDRDGRIVARMDGVWPEGVLEAAVAELLGDPGEESNAR